MIRNLAVFIVVSALLAIGAISFRSGSFYHNKANLIIEADRWIERTDHVGGRIALAAIRRDLVACEFGDAQIARRIATMHEQQTVLELQEKLYTVNSLRMCFSTARIILGGMLNHIKRFQDLRQEFEGAGDRKALSHVAVEMNVAGYRLMTDEITLTNRLRF